MDTVNAVKDFGRALSVLDSTRDIRVSIHALASASEETNAAVRAGGTRVVLEISEDRRDRHYYVTSVLALGKTMLTRYGRRITTDSGARASGSSERPYRCHSDQG